MIVTERSLYGIEKKDGPKFFRPESGSGKREGLT
jgi:hypothetical protein